MTTQGNLLIFAGLVFPVRQDVFQTTQKCLSLFIVSIQKCIFYTQDLFEASERNWEREVGILHQRFNIKLEEQRIGKLGEEEQREKKEGRVWWRRSFFDFSDVDRHEQQSSDPEPEEIIVIEMSEVCIMTS